MSTCPRKYSPSLIFVSIGVLFEAINTNGKATTKPRKSHSCPRISFCSAFPDLALPNHTRSPAQQGKADDEGLETTWSAMSGVGGPWCCCPIQHSLSVVQPG